MRKASQAPPSRTLGDGDAARPKILPRRLPMTNGAPDAVPARIVNEVLYCERLAFLEWAQGEWADNAYTDEGRWVHRRADEESGQLAPLDSTEQEDGRPYVARSVWLTSEKLGLTAKIDVVESADGVAVPIEYKRGSAPDVPEGAYLPERAQLCAQVLLLREHGFRCEEGALYFAASRRRVAIAIDDALIEITLAAVARARALCEVTEPPPPLQNSPKCDGCSLVGICLPDETNALRDEDEPPRREAERGAMVDVAVESAGPSPKTLRRLHAGRDERLPLYVQEQGARVGVEGERLVVKSKTSATELLEAPETRHDDEKRLVVKSKTSATEARLSNTSQVSIYGNVQVSTQAIRILLERGIPLFFFTYGGWFTGRLVGHDSKNIDLRIAQHRAAADVDFCLNFARALVAAKLRNARTLLRRNHAAPDPTVLAHLEQLATKSEQCDRIESLLGLEGTGARAYFGAFTGMLKGDDERLRTFDLDGRNRRPPKDRINALLSFTYGLLAKDVALALTASGLDPLLGFYHRPRFGRPALALDVMEELRPLLGDSVVMQVISTGVVAADDFVVRAGGVALTPAARRRVIAAYERRLGTEIAHPLFGYAISWRRTLEVQARLLGRVLLGELPRYPNFRTR
jgi:CRISP-associated protein Cas1